MALRGAEETPSRIEALRMYVSGSAWFAHDAAQRGTLAAGKFADLAVLSKDYLSVPVDAIGGIQSLLGQTGQWRFDEEVIGAFDLSVRFRKN